jgi:hypothetical protein
MGGACSAYGERSGVYRGLVGKLEEKRPLGRPRRIEDNIKMKLRELGYGCMTVLIWHMIETGGGHL